LREAKMSELKTDLYAANDAPSDEPSMARDVAWQGRQAAGHAISEVKDTAAEQAQRVGAEAKMQVRSVAGDVRDTLGEHARMQSDRLVSGIRRTADELDEMRGDRGDGPAATVVSRIADGGRELADYLDRHGPEGGLREVQDFARRRPGAFLTTALAAGFIIGRLGKSVTKADATAGTTEAAGDGYAYRNAGPAMPASEPAGYATATAASARYASAEPADKTNGYPGTTPTWTGNGRPLADGEYPDAGREALP